MDAQITSEGTIQCKRVQRIARSVAGDFTIEAEFVKVTDYGKTMNYNIPATPGPGTRDQVVSAWRIPAPAEIATWMTDALESEAA